MAVAPIKLDDVLLISPKRGYALRSNIEEVPVVGAQGCRCQRLEPESR